MLFSVIIPTYHRNDLLAECLDRLAPKVQTLTADNYEVIVTDDGYQTNAKDIIKHNYSWVKWVAGPCKGPAANRNNGAKYAQGEWLIFTDDDCLPDPQWLLSFSQSIESDILVYEGKTICDTNITSPLQHSPINMTGGYLWSCNMMINRSFFTYLKGFDENFRYPHLEDVDLRERIKIHGYKFMFIKKAIVIHPQKRLPYGEEIGKFQECTVYYWLKNNEDSSIVRIFMLTIYSRLVRITRFPIQLDSLLAFDSLLKELIYIFKHWHFWKKGYSDISPESIADKYN